MKQKIALAALAAMWIGHARAANQISVAPGSKGELQLRIAPPREADLIDILVSDPAVRLAVLLPDGRELTADNAEGMGFSWTDEGDEPESFAALMVAGPGRHTLIGSPEGLPVGELKIGINAQDSIKMTRVAAIRVKAKDALMLFWRDTPGVKIVEPIKLPAGSRQGKIEFALKQTRQEAYMDVAVTDPKVKVSLQFPDGRLVTKETAEPNGLFWSRTKWPDFEAFGPGVAVTLATMLPVEGLHQSISFENGIPQSGRYVLHFDASGSARASEASAMFIPRIQELFMP
jgi:hypothetical protein